jgi:BssS protein family
LRFFKIEEQAMANDPQMLSTCPVAGYTINRTVEHNALVLSFQNLTSPQQKPEDASVSPNFVMTNAQAIELAQKILRSSGHPSGIEAGETVA